MLAASPPSFVTCAEPLVEVHRGPYLESVHSTAFCVIRADGEVLTAFGDIDRAYPIRSLAKPFLARELVRSGAADAYGLGNVELALASGSHDGEQRHIAGVRSFLAKIGLDEQALSCGPALEGKLLAGPPVGNNCSGKHTAVLALCRYLGFETQDYIAVEHPVQQRLISTLFAVFGRSAAGTPLAIDGCGMPIFGASLRQIATAYAGFGSAEDLASARVRRAMAAEPGYVGGWSANLDSQIILWSGGTILSKIGAEGLHADAIVGDGIGIAIKVHDGNSRALPPILASLFLEFVDNLTISQRHLADLAAPPVLNASGRCVGEVRAASEAPL